MKRSDVWNRRLASGWIYWPATLTGLFLLALAILGPEADRRLGVEGQTAVMQAEVDALARTRDQLAATEKALQTDPNFTERVVRRELGITRPGEMRLPQPVTLEAAAPAPAQAADSRIIFPPVMEALARYGNSWLRFSALVVGCTLLASGVLLSLPGRIEAKIAK